MVKYLAILFLLFFSVSIYAQSTPVLKGNGQIVGIVLGNDTQSPIEYATVILYRNGTKNAIGGATANDKGIFKITDLPNGIYKIDIEFVGYKTLSIDKIEIDNAHLNINVNTINLVKSKSTLTEVTVKSSAKTIDNKIDKMVFNAEKDISAQNGVATDLLKKIPMVSVDIDGNVQLAGTSSIRFLINGKPSVAYGSNINEVLQSIPASEIKTVEVITNPGAKYDADGLGGIINIVLKQNKTKGYNGNISTSVGTRIENGSINLAARNNNFGASLFIATNARLLAATPMTMARTTVDSLNKSYNYLQQEGSSDVKRQGMHSGLNLDWTYLKKNSFNASFGLNGFGTDATGYNNQILTSQPFGGAIVPNALLHNVTNNSFSENSNYNFGANYKRTFDKEGREFELAYSASNIGNAKFNINSGAMQYDAVTQKLIYGSTNLNATKETESEFKFDYSEPISDNVKLNLGSKITNLGIASATNVFLQTSSQSLKQNNSLSNTLDYKQHVVAVYSELEFPIKDWVEVKLGGRFEQTNVNALFSKATQLVNPSYNNFVPSIFFKRKLGEDNSIKLSYSRRINRPGAEELNPYINTTDPKNMTQGNPYLLPELGERIELTYSQEIKELGSLMLTVFQRNSDQDIQPYVMYYPSLQVGDSLYYNVNLSKSQNIGLEKNTGVNVFSDFKISNALSIRSNFSYYYRIIYNTIDHFYNPTSQNYRANINLTYEFSKTLVTEWFGNYNSARNEVQGKYPANLSYSFALRKKFWNGKGSLGLLANNPFAEFIEQQTFITGPNFNSNNIRYVPSRSFGISFNWRFGKLEFKKERKEEGGMEESAN
jgi:outer membrane receptor protein involved in Fe transport